MRTQAEGGCRFDIVLNGLPLFTGAAGSGESEIRRYVLANDLLDTGVTDKGREHRLAVLATMFNRSAFERGKAKGQSSHDRARRDAALYGQRVAARRSTNRAPSKA